MQNRWQRFGTSIFTTMTQLARKHDAINLAQGFPDFDGPQVIKDAAVKAMADGFNQYCVSYGIPELRELIGRRKEKTSGQAYDPEKEITVFSGATEAIFCAVVALTEPGDEVLAFEPFYDSYPQAAFATGARFKGITLKAPDWSFDPQELAAKITKKSKILILNTPHNPTGKVFTKTELLEIARIADQHDLTVIADEVYEEIVFKPAEHLSIATLPGMRERTITISSTSKTYSMTGWKVGFAFAAPGFTQALRTVHQSTVFCSATPLQYGMLPALKLPDAYYEELRREYRERRDFLTATLNRHGFECKAPDGSYFILASYAGKADLDDVAMAEKLTREAKVATIPISGFHEDADRARKELRFLRFGFCKNLKTLGEADARFSAYFGR